MNTTHCVTGESNLPTQYFDARSIVEKKQFTSYMRPGWRQE